MSIYTGVTNIAKKAKGYVGVGGVAKKLKSGYIGDANGIARKFYSAFNPFIGSGYSYIGWSEYSATYATIISVSASRVAEAIANGCTGIRLTLTQFTKDEQTTSPYWINIKYNGSKIVSDGGIRSFPYAITRGLNANGMTFQWCDNGSYGQINGKLYYTATFY